jgi:hypothetical protein
MDPNAPRRNTQVQPGQPGNPTGKEPGARKLMTILAEAT